MQDQQSRKSQPYPTELIGRKLEIEIGFQIRDTEAEAEVNITPEVEAIEALTGAVAEEVGDTLEIILSIGTISQEQSMCLQDPSDNEKKVKHEARVLILKLSPKEDDSGVQRLTLTVRFMKVQVTKIV